MGGLSCLFLKIDQKYHNFGKNYPVCVHLWVKFSIKMRFYEYFGEKTRKLHPADPFFCMLHMKCLSKCLYSNKSLPPRKIAGGPPITFILTFNPDFNLNICVFANLAFTEIWFNISLVFWKPRIFCLVLFCMRYKIVCTYKDLH